jgi:hypothetical protein
MSELATLQLSPIFHDFRSRVTGLRDQILTDASKIVRREEETSIRLRWHRSGATLMSLKEEVTEDGNRKTYKLYPTAVSPKGAPYPTFGEYGTGRRGAQSGKPAPRGYSYGSSAGMTARRYSRIALSIAKPQVDQMANESVRRFALNATVN